MDGQVTWLDLGISCGKTWSEPLAATKEKTSQPCSKRSSKSSSRKPPVLKCLKRVGLPGEGITMKWEDDGAWCGELTTRNTGECPNAVVVSRLSQILEETPHPKYNEPMRIMFGVQKRQNPKAGSNKCAAVFKREIGETLRETSKDQRKNRHHVWAFAPHRVVCPPTGGRLGLLGERSGGEVNGRCEVYRGAQENV